MLDTPLHDVDTALRDDLQRTLNEAEAKASTPPAPGPGFYGAYSDIPLVVRNLVVQLALKISAGETPVSVQFIPKLHTVKLPADYLHRLAQVLRSADIELSVEIGRGLNPAPVTEFYAHRCPVAEISKGVDRWQGYVTLERFTIY